MVPTYPLTYSYGYGIVIPMDKTKPVTLYFIVAPEVNKIKIGTTQRPLAKRLKELKTYSPVPLYLLAYVTVVGTKSLEIEEKTHSDLKNNYSHGEWFWYDNKIREYVANLIWNSEHYGRFGNAGPMFEKRKYIKAFENEWGRKTYPRS
jgi:hypothetical protein